MSDYNEAWSALARAVGGSFTSANLDKLSTAEQLEAAKIAALLSISQEISDLNPRNHSGPNDDDGEQDRSVYVYR